MSDEACEALGAVVGDVHARLVGWLKAGNAKQRSTGKRERRGVLERVKAKGPRMPIPKRARVMGTHTGSKGT
jgi:hypothetical protein